MTFEKKWKTGVNEHQQSDPPMQSGFRPGRGHRAPTPDGTATQGTDCRLLHPRTCRLPVPRATLSVIENNGIHARKQFEQGGPDYDPQVVAMHWPSLATIVYRIAVGRA